MEKAPSSKRLLKREAGPSIRRWMEPGVAAKAVPRLETQRAGVELQAR